MTEFAKKMYTNLIDEKERAHFYANRDACETPQDWPIGDWCPGIDAKEVVGQRHIMHGKHTPWHVA